MVKGRTVVASVLVLFGSVLTLPACSSSSSDDAGPSCTNLTKDDGEEGVDCGGICPTKCTGSVCTAGMECASGTCTTAKTCAAPAGKPCGVGATPPVCADGQACELDKDCSSGFCDGKTCATPSMESHSDGKKDSGETGIDCGGSVKATAPCPDGQGCIDNTDCTGTCANLICSPKGPMDGKKDGDETDVDCGGAKAPKCDDGKGCAKNEDCKDDYCPTATKKCTKPTYSDGDQNGDETDVDCGGTITNVGFKKCAEDKNCLVDTDCNGACKTRTAAGPPAVTTHTCIDIPSCKNVHGGETCGTNEVGTGAESHLGPAGAVMMDHESCCRTLPVAGFTDPRAPGKAVYLDKYEITAGRMRAFLESVGGGNVPVLPAGSTNAKPPNVKAYMAAHEPPAAQWNPGWENVLPGDNSTSQATYVVKDATADMLYPGQDQYVLNHYTQNTWWIRATGATDTATQTPGQQGTYTVDTGIFYTMISGTMFPEYYANPAVWPPPNEGEGYAVNHALNCYNGHGAYGWSTYWFDAATVQQYSGGVGKAYPETTLDEKALNCTPNALFAAFCAWDGGMLATAEVIDYITGNTVSPIYDAGGTQNGKLAVGNSLCAGNTLNTFSDGTQGCYNVYYYPGFPDGSPTATVDYDDSSKIAPPGRVIGDVISINAADEPWMDLIGNLQEAVIRKGETTRFDYRGYGVEYGSITHHHNQQSTPRQKGGAFGARCMRFK